MAGVPVPARMALPRPPWNVCAGRDRDKLPERKWGDSQRLSVAAGIASGMAYLHAKRVCHRDLKSFNCLYDRHLCIKLCDLGFSKFKERNSIKFESRIGTPAWMAPEVLNGEEYDHMSDVYSYGIILWELARRPPPSCPLTTHPTTGSPVDALWRSL